MTTVIASQERIIAHSTTASEIRTQTRIADLGASDFVYGYLYSYVLTSMKEDIHPETGSVECMVAVNGECVVGIAVLRHHDSGARKEAEIPSEGWDILDGIAQPILQS